MSQANELPVPTKIPDELWHEIKYLKAALLTFAYNARMCVEGKQLCTGEYDLNFHDWLQPLVETANQMNNIKRYCADNSRSDPVPQEIRGGKVTPSSWPEITDPHPIGALLDPDLGVNAVIERTQEGADPPAPTDAIPQAPLRHHASGGCPCLPGTPLTCPTGFAPWKTPCAGHGSSLSS
jgi:hypothetical protein